MYSFAVYTHTKKKITGTTPSLAPVVEAAGEVAAADRVEWKAAWWLELDGPLAHGL